MIEAQSPFDSFCPRKQPNHQKVWPNAKTMSVNFFFFFFLDTQNSGGGDLITSVRPKCVAKRFAKSMRALAHQAPNLREYDVSDDERVPIRTHPFPLRTHPFSLRTHPAMYCQV
jgi:hypothetical protein